MLAFILATVLFLIAGNGILKIFFDMIQPEGALDIFFGWQKMLAKLYKSENKFAHLLEKALGGCEQCTAFWFMPVWFFMYYAVMKLSFHSWITDFITISGFWQYVAIAFVNWAWYCMFHTIGAMGGKMILVMFKKKTDGV